MVVYCIVTRLALPYHSGWRTCIAPFQGVACLHCPVLDGGIAPLQRVVWLHCPISEGDALALPHRRGWFTCIASFQCFSSFVNSTSTPIESVVPINCRSCSTCLWSRNKNCCCHLSTAPRYTVIKPQRILKCEQFLFEAATFFSQKNNNWHRQLQVPTSTTSSTHNLNANNSDQKTLACTASH